ncbi:alpha/beta fold hydrolase [Pseudonocardia sp. WMMC193]|uniref:alpha/beta fold hydrolase n=1 Tax=Pseudonocardia sp. WMMC193 TaxID=2911965 RepID=UPI001F37776F|nr:alpha/beta fold hydrolase [Pseudonocardia sp. WMMC193]MCF7550806.1 alpha/beta fold hydrolase [Pseudonocardia sp. WMMC193]
MPRPPATVAGLAEVTPGRHDRPFLEGVRERRLAMTACGRALSVAGLAAAAVALDRIRRLPPFEPLPVTPRSRGGSGTPLLLLHGIGGTWQLWRPVLEDLQARHDVLAVTFRGHAGAPPLGDAATPEALADAVEEELDAAGLGPVHIVGNSLGGWVAIELARRGRARSLVLLSPGGAWRHQYRMDAVASSIGAFNRVLSRVTGRSVTIARSPVLRALLLAGQVAHPSRMPADVLELHVRVGNDMPGVPPLLETVTKRQVDQLPADHDYPIRLVWGRADRVIPFGEFGTAMLERLPGAEVIRPHGLGHVPMTDDPGLVTRLVLEVTRAVDGPAPT